MPNDEEVKEVLNKYREKFGKGFPVFHFTNSNDKIQKMVDIINESLKTGKPYKMNLPAKTESGKPIVY